jgi:hypothetical protein
VDPEPELDPSLELVAPWAPPEEELAVGPEVEPELDTEGDPEPDPEPELAMAPELFGVPGLAPPLELEPPTVLEPPPVGPTDGALGSGGIGCGFRSHPCAIARTASASTTLGRRGMRQS